MASSGFPPGSTAKDGLGQWWKFDGSAWHQCKSPEEETLAKLVELESKLNRMETLLKLILLKLKAHAQ